MSWLSKSLKSATSSKSKKAHVGEELLSPGTLQEHEAKAHPDSHDQGGLECRNDKLLKEQQDAIVSWIKSMGSKLFSGKFNVLSTPFPVEANEPRSYLEKLTDAWVYPRYLRTASLLSHDPVERMKLVICWFVAGLHHGFERWKKPFNPLLGETYQGVMADGSTIFLEQISHHPPVSAWTLYGPGRCYTYSGLSQPQVELIFSCYGFKTIAKGWRHLDFPDGTRIDIHYPEYYIKGVVYSNRPRAEVEGTAVLTDLKHGIKAVLRFGANKGSRFPVLRRSDAIMGEIYDLGPGLQHGVSLPSPWEPLTELCGEDSGLLDDAGPGQGSEDSEGWETASETDFALREVKRRGEADRETAGSREPSLLSVDQQLAQSKGRLLSDVGPSNRTHRTDGQAGAAGGATTVKAVPSAPNLGTGGTTRPPAQDARRPPLPQLALAHVASSTSSAAAASGVGDDQGTVVARVEGSWLSHLNINSKRYWTLVDEKPDVWQPAPGALPSDSRHRPDLIAIRQGDIKGAQVWKESLEEKQRQEKKLREGTSKSKF